MIVAALPSNLRKKNIEVSLPSVMSYRSDLKHCTVFKSHFVKVCKLLSDLLEDVSWRE